MVCKACLTQPTKSTHTENYNSLSRVDYINYCLKIEVLHLQLTAVQLR